MDAMPTRGRILAAVLLILTLAAPSTASAESLAMLSPVGLLRPEWTVERTRPGRAQVVGYLYNDNGVRNAANVWLRVEQRTAAGAAGTVYQTRLVGNVLSRGRTAFEVPVTETEETTTYRVTVESVDWVMECR